MKKIIKKIIDVSFLKKNSFEHPLETSYQFLEKINDIKFTNREIDVLACIVSGRASTKTIASFLSIEPKTVEVYVRSIRTKLGSSSRESIISYIEVAKRSLHARNHYLFLLIQSTFEQTLKKIIPLISQKDLPYLIIYEKCYEPFIKILEKYFKYLKINIIIKVKEEDKSLEEFFEELGPQLFDHYFFIASSLQCKQILKNITPLPSFIESSENITFVFLNEESETETLEEICNTYSVFYVTFGKNESYYFSLFNILKRLFIDDKIDKLILEFKEHYASIIENLNSIVEKNHNLNEDYSLRIETEKKIKSINNNKPQNMFFIIFKKIQEKFNILLILIFIILIRDIIIKEESAISLISYLQSCSLFFKWFCTLIVCFMAIIFFYKKFYVEGLYLYNAVVIIIANIYIENFEIVNLLAISTFLVNDILIEFHGRKIAQNNIFFTVYAQLLLVILVILITSYNEKTVKINMNYLVSNLSVKTFTASLLSFMFTQWLNVLIFEHLPRKSSLLNLWLRISLSILFIGTIDSFIFEYLDHSLLSKEAGDLNEVITKYVNINFNDQALFLISSVFICWFFYNQNTSDSNLNIESLKNSLKKYFSRKIFIKNKDDL